VSSDDQLCVKKLTAGYIQGIHRGAVLRCNGAFGDDAVDSLICNDQNVREEETNIPCPNLGKELPSEAASHPRNAETATTSLRKSETFQLQLYL